MTDHPRSLEQVFPEVPSFLTMDATCQRYLMQGWYDEETDGRGSYRWTRKEFSFLIRPERAVLQLDVEGTLPEHDRPPLEGTLSMLGGRVGGFNLEKAGPCQLLIPLPANTVGKVTPFRIELNRTWRPRDTIPNSLDKRELGLAIRAICAK
jgi:hypothetical protein